MKDKAPANLLPARILGLLPSIGAPILRLMSIHVLFISLTFALLMQFDSNSASFNYPKARPGDQVDDYHGTQVKDPYRWLENPDEPESRAWIEAENKITFDYLAKIPARAKIKARLLI